MKNILVSLLVLSSLQFACKNPANAYEAKESGPPIIRVPVFYATDRAKITSNKDDAGFQLSGLKLGCATVSLPMRNEWLGERQDKLKPALSNFGCQIDQDNSTQEPYIEMRGYVAEPEPQKMLSDIRECADFFAKVKDAAVGSQSRSVFVYIHGFASSGNNAIYSGGVLAANVEGPVISFTWPSKGIVGLKHLRFWGKKQIRELYKADKEMIEDPQVLSDLKSLIKELRSNLPPDVHINLVAHSMGNRLLSKYLGSDAEERFEKVYFLAPDVDNELFLQIVPKLRKKVRYCAVFHNPNDKVLRIAAASDLFSLKNTDKLGAGGVDLTGIEFVDYGKIAEPRSVEFLRLLHFIPFEHFANILRTGVSNVSDNDEVSFIVHRSTIEKRKKDKLTVKEDPKLSKVLPIQ